ncbi:hypothetical protein D3C86_1819560 [compost metagenome]
MINLWTAADVPATVIMASTSGASGMVGSGTNMQRTAEATTSGYASASGAPSSRLITESSSASSAPHLKPGALRSSFSSVDTDLLFSRLAHASMPPG